MRHLNDNGTLWFLNLPELASPRKMSIKVYRFIDVVQLNEYSGLPRSLASSLTVSALPFP